MLQPVAIGLFPELDGQFPMDGSDGTGALPPAGSPAAQIVIRGRRLEPTPVFDTYWRFAAARQALYEARLRGQAAPWTSDPILRRHRFTNCYRAADRVSQFLISQVIYAGSRLEPLRLAADHANGAVDVIKARVLDNLGQLFLLAGEAEANEPVKVADGPGCNAQVI